jgi:hypothetical protein
MLYICASEFATQVTVLRSVSPSESQEGKSKNFSEYSILPGSLDTVAVLVAVDLWGCSPEGKEARV